MDLSHHAFGGIGRVGIVHDDLGPLGRQGEGNGTTNPPARSGHQGDVSSECLASVCLGGGHRGKNWMKGSYGALRLAKAKGSQHRLHADTGELKCRAQALHTLPRGQAFRWPA